MHTLSLPRRELTLSLVMLAVGCAALAFFGRDARAADATVSIDNFAFSPNSVSVAVGETVTWTHNQAGVPHTVTSDTAGVMDSDTLGAGETFSRTFTEAGTIAYHCNIHSNMTGTVIVTGAAATATTAAPAATATVAAPTATTAAATATTAATAAPTATAASGSTAPASASSPTASSASPAATSSPQPPSTGAADDDDGGSNAVLVGGVVAVLVLAAGGAGYALMRRRSM